MAHSREGVEPCDPTCTRPTGCRGTPPPGRTTATRPTKPPSSATAVPRSIEELQLLGHLDGLRLLHLQCNAGQDSLSLARLGARVTGVDIGDSAIDFARQLSRDSIAADFQRDDILRWLPVAATRGERFERVFASYGTLVWLSDLKRWADGIAQVLVPGGRFVLVEFHPFALYFDPHWQPAYDYFSREPIAESGVSDYVAESGASLAPSGYRAGVENFSNPHPSYEFQWGLADVIGALLGAGLQLERLEEYPTPTAGPASTACATAAADACCRPPIVRACR